MFSLNEIIDKWNNALENTIHNEQAVKRQHNIWEKTARTYDNSMGRDYVRLNACIKALNNRKMLSKDYYAVDIGCGTGELSIMISPYVKWVDAIDESSAMLDVMKNKLANDTLNISLINKDFFSLNNSNYDLAISNYNPATYNPKSFENYLDMGKCGLFSASSTRATNDKRDRLKTILFGEDHENINGMRIEYPYEYLKAKGFSPELSISVSKYPHSLPVEEAIEQYIGIFSLMKDYSRKNEDTIKTFIRYNSYNGIFTEHTEYRTGILTWIK